MKKNNQLLFFFAILLIIGGAFLLSENYINDKIDKSFNTMNLKLLALNEEIKEEKTSQNEEVVIDDVSDTTIDVEEEKKIKEINYNYIGKLKIPKIGLEQGFVNKNSKYNSVDYGIEILKESSFPNVNKSNLIMLSHSGSSYRAKFKELYKLKLGDLCYIDYQGKVYKFKITKIYNKPKIGKVIIDRDYNKTTLTLITCTHNSKTEQTIYIAELA